MVYPAGQPVIRPAVKLSMASLFIALALSSNYLLVNIPNVKLMDALTFISAYTLGLPYGMLVAAMTWIIYGVLNPYGMDFVTLLIVITGEMIYVIAGTAVSKMRSSIPEPVLFGFIGGISTLGYDIYTNALVGVLFYGSIWAGLLTMNFPLPLGIVHEVSNVLFFAIATPILLRLIEAISKSKTEVRKLPAIGVGAWPTIAAISILVNMILAGVLLYIYPQMTDAQARMNELESLLSRFTIRANLLINFGNGTRRWYNNTRVNVGSTLINLTIEAFGSKTVNFMSSEYGIFLISIGGVGSEDVKPNHYWMWWKWEPQKSEWNLGQIGADAYKVSDGDILAWHYQDVSKWPNLEKP